MYLSFHYGQGEEWRFFDFFIVSEHYRGERDDNFVDTFGVNITP